VVNVWVSIKIKSDGVSDEPVTLDFLGLQLRRVLAEMADFREQMAEFRDQLTVQTAILLRLETAQNTMAEQLRAWSPSFSAPIGA